MAVSEMDDNHRKRKAPETTSHYACNDSPQRGENVSDELVHNVGKKRKPTAISSIALGPLDALPDESFLLILKEYLSVRCIFSLSLSSKGFEQRIRMDVLPALLESYIDSSHQQALVDQFDFVLNLALKIRSKWAYLYALEDAFRGGKRIGAGFYHSVVHMVDRRETLSTGRGRHGVLGIGRNRNAFLFEKIQCLSSIRVASISAGESHTVLLISGGIVMTYGHGLYGRLGHGNEVDVATPKIIHSLRKEVIVRVSAGDAHTLVLNDDGEVFSFGWNLYLNTGINTMNNVLDPTKVFSGTKCREISAGGRHSLFLDINRSLWDCGSQYSTPLRKKEAFSKYAIDQIATGRNHSMALTLNGRVYTWSPDSTPALGAGSFRYPLDLSEYECTPRVVEPLMNQRIVKIDAAADVSCALSSEGKLFTFGEGRFGSLGHGVPSTEHLPRRVESLSGEGIRVQQVSCGEKHMVAFSDGQRRAFSWGDGTFGKLGLGHTHTSAVPTEIPRLHSPPS